MPKKISKELKLAAVKKIFSKDIEAFGKFFFPHHLKVATPEFHKKIYQTFEDESLERIAIGAPRAHAKSTVTDLVYLAWEICNGRKHFILLVSDTYSQATLFLESLKAEFEGNDKLKAMYPKLVSQRWSEGEIVANNTLVKAVGAGMKVRGLKYRDSRPDLIVVDDLENDEMVESRERREKLERWVNGALVPSLAKNGRIIFIGTILHYDSLLYKLLDKEQYKEYHKQIYKAITNGTALWPEHLSIDELEEIKNDYIAKGQGHLFYQEYQNDPISDENRKFKLELFKYYVEEKVDDYLFNTYIAVDRAYSLDATADYTGIVIGSVDVQNNLYVRHAERFKGLEKDLLDRLFELKSRFTPLKIGIEQKAFRYTLKPTLDDEMRRRNSWFNVIELSDGGRAKNLRIEGLLPRFESGSIFIKKEHTDLIDELVRFPKAPHDDLSDALAHLLTMIEAPNQNITTNYEVEEYDSYGENGLA